MKKFYVLFLFLYFGFYFSQNKIKKDLPYNFYENKGQIIDQNGKENSAVKYLFNSGGLNVQIKKDGFSYDVYEVKKTKNKQFEKNKNLLLPKDKFASDYNFKYQYHRVDIDFVGANKNPEIIAIGKSNDYDNYYNVPNKPKGVEKVYRYQKIIYKNLYPNVDLAFFKPDDTLKPIEYNFIINPGGKISDIKLKFKGAKTKLKNRKLSMNLRFGEMQENIPNSWIEDLNSKKDIKINFKETGNQTFGFESSQDTFDKTVVIDPVPTRVWGTLYGGSGYDTIEKLEIDEFNNLYLGGMTMSNDNYMATSGAYITTFTGNLDGFIAKFDENGNRIWGSYLDNTISYGSLDALDFDRDNLFILLKADDQQVLKLKKDGTYLWTHHISSDKTIFDILVKNGFFYIGGSISQSNISKPYVEKFNLKGVLQKKYIIQNSGSGKFSCITNFSDDSSLDIFAIGQTESNGIFTQNPLQNSLGGDRDLLLFHFDSDLNPKQVSYYGDARADLPIACKFENGIFKVFYKIWPIVNNIYVGSVLKYNVNTDAIISNNQFLLPYNQDLTGYFDPIGNLFIGGSSYPNQPNIATPNAYQTSTGINNKSIMMLYDNNENKVWGTFYGGNGSTGTAFIRRDSKNYIYMIGSAIYNTSGMATPGAFQSNNNSTDGYIAKFFDCTSIITLLSSNSPVCPNSDIKLQASGGSTYSWSGPNNFTSTDQNPTIPNATAINSGTYSCVISGAGDCDGTFTVDVKVEDKTAPVPNIANLQDISGDCKTIVSVIPTATDACAGNILATTKSPLQYSIPGTYVIVWDYDDGNGNISHQNQNITISSPALPTANATQQFCSTENRTVADLQITGQNVKWYDETGSILDQNFKLIDGNYYASQIINGCESDKIKVSVKINVTPLPTADANQDFCSSQNAKISDLKVTGTNLKFYDSAGNSLANSTLLQDNSSYFVTQTVNSCESDKFEIKVVISQNALPANDFSFSICNDTTSNTKTEDLTKYQDNLIANSSTYIFEYFDHNQNAISDFKNRILSLGQNIFNVKVSTNLGCFKIVQLTLQLNEKPKINLPETAEFCAGKSVELDAGFNPTYSYEWSSGEKTNKISINQEGTYTVKVTSNFGCENTASTVVKKSLIAEILKVEITNNNAKVILSASGDFEYSLDNKIWQDSNEFKNLANGNYTVYVRTKLGCIIGEKDFSIFNISNTFTPNGDGKNDTWKIDGLENYPNSEVSVYDATGKRVLFKITSGAFEWDGKLNSRNLPTATYWYNIKVSDGRILNGYLLLKNRN
ncbi:gliding motility-associated C-terminal domain-containing protein [Halpernia humi]|uniref:Gliding motility-associated C-terminal domain-containing protein n=1 Tax=Halpernia humi TaxID=493375 RepID=A0A1H5ZXR7_9FLAO|nr:T9SS type B sorting domain-containing protein [Halpernia humi]SEG41001.1 gliding motility-associated C-terminal domain-containing protein [Halpernia humi]